MKFSDNVSPEKRAGATTAAEGLIGFGPIGLSLGVVGGSVGMLKGLISGILDNKKKSAQNNNTDNLIGQRDSIKDEHLKKLKDSYRK